MVRKFEFIVLKINLFRSAFLNFLFIDCTDLTEKNIDIIVCFCSTKKIKQKSNLVLWEDFQHMFLVVHGIQSPKRFKSSTCCQQDFIAPRVHRHKLCDVVDAAFVSDPHSVFQTAVLCDFIVAEDRTRRLSDICLLGLNKNRENINWSVVKIMLKNVNKGFTL